MRTENFVSMEYPKNTNKYMRQKEGTNPEGNSFEGVMIWQMMPRLSLRTRSNRLGIYIQWPKLLCL